MFSRKGAFSRRPMVSVMAFTCLLAAASAALAAGPVTVTIPVSVQGVDLSNRAAVLAFYQRLQNAAWVACTDGNRIDLVPVDNRHECTENAVGAAIGAAHVALLTQVYLETHSIGEAKAHGIEVPMVAGTKPNQP